MKEAMDVSGFIEIFTEHLLLRPLRISDAEEMFDYRSDTEFNCYQGWVPREITETYDFINNRVSADIDIPGTWFQFAILDKESHEMIGDLGIYFSKVESSEVELGITLSRKYTGRGWAGEALGTAVSYLVKHLGKKRMVAYIAPDNIRSCRLFERLGFCRTAMDEGAIESNPEDIDLKYILLLP